MAGAKLQWSAQEIALIAKVHAVLVAEKAVFNAAGMSLANKVVQEVQK
jgi:hypothetical protein